jgi:hypothetical protein
VIVEPRPGGGGIIGADAVAGDARRLHAAALANPLSILPAMGKSLPFDVPASFCRSRGGDRAVRDRRQQGCGVPDHQRADRLRQSAAGQVAYASVGRLAAPYADGAVRSKVGIDIVHVPYGRRRRCRTSSPADPVRLLVDLLDARPGAGRQRARWSSPATSARRSVPDAPTAERPACRTEANSCTAFRPAGTPAHRREGARRRDQIFADPALQAKLIAGLRAGHGSGRRPAFKAQIERKS